MNQKICLTVAVAALLSLIASTSMAGLVIDVRAVAGTGYEVDATGKIVTVLAPGAILNLQLWGTISGTDAIASNDSLQTVYGGILQTRLDTTSVMGNLLNPGMVSPFNLDTEADHVDPLLLGAQSPAPASGSGYLIARASLMQNDQVNLVDQYELYTAQYAVTSLGDNGTVGASINYVKPVVGTSSYGFNIDGVTKTGKAGTAGYDLVTIGAPVTVSSILVPEPSTFVMLGLACLALLAIRRRK